MWGNPVPKWQPWLPTLGSDEASKCDLSCASFWKLSNGRILRRRRRPSGGKAVCSITCPENPVDKDGLVKLQSGQVWSRDIGETRQVINGLVTVRRTYRDGCLAYYVKDATKPGLATW